jgi:drug/metabolite transporter (DMT)-like permease
MKAGKTMRTFVVILIATICAAIGEVLLSYGMRKSGEVDLTVPSQWIDLILSVVRNPYVLAGVVLLAVFFFLYLASLSWDDISYVMPLTAMSFIFVALMAKFVLKEDISWYRWAGTVLIVVGIAFVGLENKDIKAGKAVKPDVSDNGQKVVEAIDKSK